MSTDQRQGVQISAFIKEKYGIEFPHFPYYPDPIHTKSIELNPGICDCCGKHSDYRHTGGIYSAIAEGEEEFCPWCIADGSAARVFQGTFNCAGTDIPEDVPPEVLRHVEERTPHLETWQDNDWLYHCADACECHGDATREDLLAFNGEDLETFLKTYSMSHEDWAGYVSVYQPVMDPAVYKFKCRKCGKLLYYMDFT